MSDNLAKKQTSIQYVHKKIYLCSISNVQSGSCSQDCKFCAQSAHYGAEIEKYRQKDISIVVNEAKIAKQNGAVGFCLVTAALGLNDSRLEYISRCAKAIKDARIDINIIASNGIASKEQLKELKKHGVVKYNHNLESSKNFRSNLCTTHSWDDRYQTCLNVNSVGLKLCSGGIFGVGETWEDRESLMQSLKELKPFCTPLNFYHPNPALPIKSNSLDIEDGLKIVKLARTTLGNTPKIMLAGGREYLFKNRFKEAFSYGANAIIIGDYLTTSGFEANEELQELKKAGFTIAPRA